MVDFALFWHTGVPFSGQHKTKARGDKKGEIELQNILSDKSSLRYLVRFPNCHECPVASGLGNLTIRYHAQLLIWLEATFSFSLWVTLPHYHYLKSFS